MAGATTTSVNHHMLPDFPVQHATTLPEGRPQSSPYASAPVWLSFGSSMQLHLIPRTLLPPSILSNRRYWDSQDLSPSVTRLVHIQDIDADVAHTFVHYLHTGEYQTLNSPAFGEPPIGTAEGNSREHRRALLSYVAATTHELDGLRRFARERADALCWMLPPWVVLQDVEVAYQNLQERDDWLDSHMKDFIRKYTNAEGETTGKGLGKGLKSIFARSLLDAAFDVLVDIVVQREEDALQMPTAPDMVSDESGNEGSGSELSFDAEVIDLDRELERRGDEHTSIDEAQEPRSPDAVTASIPDSEIATLLEMPHRSPRSRTTADCLPEPEPTVNTLPSVPPKHRRRAGRDVRVVYPDHEWINLPPAPPPPPPINVMGGKDESSSERTATPHPGSFKETAPRQHGEPVFQLPMLPHNTRSMGRWGEMLPPGMAAPPMFPPGMAAPPMFPPGMTAPPMPAPHSKEDKPGMQAPPPEKSKYKKKKKATKRARAAAGGPPLPPPTDGWFPAPPGPQLSHPMPPLLDPFPPKGRTGRFPFTPADQMLPPPPPPPPPPPGTEPFLLSMPPANTQQLQMQLQMQQTQKTTAALNSPAPPATPPPPPPMKMPRRSMPPPPMPLSPMMMPPPPPPPPPLMTFTPMGEIISGPGPGPRPPYSPATASSVASSSVASERMTSSDVDDDDDDVRGGRRRPAAGGGATCALMSAHLAGRGWRRCEQCKALVMLATQVARGQRRQEEEEEEDEDEAEGGSESDGEDNMGPMSESAMSEAA